MASEKILIQKKQLVEEISAKLKDAASIVLVDYIGINVADDTNLRSELREAGVEYIVVKNSILKYAFENAGLNDFLPELKGSTAVAISKEDAIAPAKVLQKYSDKLKKIFNIKIGTVEGKICTTEELKAIATLPSRETLIAQVAGSFNSIIASFARAISEVAKQKDAA